MKDVPVNLRVALGLLLIATAVAYLPTAGHSFISLDDVDYVYANPMVTQGVTPSGVAWAFSTFMTGNWHPLTWVSHMLDVSLFGVNAGAHHMVNVAFHLTNVVLLFLFFTRMGVPVWGAFWASAIFALHPLRIESVAWTSERKDLLCALFYLLALLAYDRFVRNPSTKGRLRVVLLMAAGLLCKPMLVTLPLLLLLLDLLLYRRIGEGRGAFVDRVVEKAPLFVLTLLSSAVAMVAQASAGALQTFQGVSLGMRLCNAIISYWKYLGMTVWPSGLAILYPLPPVYPPPSYVAVAMILLIVVSVVAWRLRERAPYLLLGWGWYLVTLLPVIGIIQVGVQAMADRYTYIPQIGILMAVAWGMCDMTSSCMEKVGGERSTAVGWSVSVVGVLCVVALAIGTVQRIKDWKDSMTLYNSALTVTTGNYVMHNNLGIEYAERKDFAKAISHYREAVRFCPTYADAHFNMASDLEQIGMVTQAVAHYRWALHYKPNDVDARKALERLGVPLFR